MIIYFVLPLYKLFALGFFYKYYKGILLVSLLIGLFPYSELLRLSDSFIPNMYVSYVKTDSYLADFSFFVKMGKISSLPIYIILISLIPVHQISFRSFVILNIGIFSESIRLITMGTNLLSRLGYYFCILSVIPICDILIYSKKNGYLYVTLFVYILFLYLYKLYTTYSYNSIFFN